MSQPTKEDRFERFHQANPHIFSRLVELVREFRKRGVERLSIRMLIDYVRMECWVNSDLREPFKINNNYCPHYARLLIRAYPEFADLFELRKVGARNEMTQEEYDALCTYHETLESLDDDYDDFLATAYD